MKTFYLKVEQPTFLWTTIILCPYEHYKGFDLAIYKSFYRFLSPTIRSKVGCTSLSICFNFTSCCLRAEGSPSSLAQQMEKCLLMEVSSTLPAFLRVSNVEHTVCLIPLLTAQLGFYAGDDKLLRHLVERYCSALFLHSFSCFLFDIFKTLLNRCDFNFNTFYFIQNKPIVRVKMSGDGG